MLDTNFCIAVMRADAGSKISGRFNRHADQFCISTIVLAELHYGAENSMCVPENLLKISKFTSALKNVLDFDAKAAAEFGRLRTALRRTPIGPIDTLIAAHARSRELVVVTSNASEFHRVPGLSVEDWLA